MLSSLIMKKDTKYTNWISTGISSEEIKPFHTNLEPPMSNLANGRLVLKFNNSVLVQKHFAPLYSNIIFKFHSLLIK